VSKSVDEFLKADWKKVDGDSPELWRCSRRGCGWVGADSQKDNVPIKDYLPLKTIELRCPKCGCNSFYVAKRDTRKAVDKSTSGAKHTAMMKLYTAVLNGPDAGGLALILAVDQSDAEAMVKRMNETQPELDKGFYHWDQVEYVCDTPTLGNSAKVVKAQKWQE
jgi:hypothetical protein